jgi:hypothetical protein
VAGNVELAFAVKCGWGEVDLVAGRNSGGQGLGMQNILPAKTIFAGQESTKPGADPRVDHTKSSRHPPPNLASDDLRETFARRSRATHPFGQAHFGK